jgi:hypothetical protein
MDRVPAMIGRMIPGRLDRLLSGGPGLVERGYQANAKIITTSDEILQELINLKR